MWVRVVWIKSVSPVHFYISPCSYIMKAKDVKIAVELSYKCSALHFKSLLLTSCSYCIWMICRSNECVLIMCVLKVTSDGRGTVCCGQEVVLGAGRI